MAYAASAVTGREMLDCQIAISKSIQSHQYALAMANIRSQCSGTDLISMRVDGRNIFHMLAEWGEDGSAEDAVLAAGSMEDERIDGMFGQLVDLVYSLVGKSSKLASMLNELDPKGDTALVSAVRHENDKLGLKYIRWGADDSIAGADKLRVRRGVINAEVLKQAVEIMKTATQARPAFSLEAIDTFSGPPETKEPPTFAQTAGTGYNGQRGREKSQATRLAQMNRKKYQRGGCGSDEDGVDEPAQEPLSGGGADTEQYLERIHDQFRSHMPMRGGGEDRDMEEDDDDDEELSGGGDEFIHGSRQHYNTLSELEENQLADSHDDEDDHRESMMRNYREDDTKIHEETLEEIKKVMKLGDSEEDAKLLKAIKATLWKKAKEAVKAEVEKMETRPENINRMKSERMLSLATKKYINSIKDEIDATAEDMELKAKERENTPIDISSESEKPRKQRKQKPASESSETPEEKPKKQRKPKKDEMSLTTMSD